MPILCAMFLLGQIPQLICAFPVKGKSDDTLIASKGSLTADMKTFTLGIRFMSSGEFSMACQQKGVTRELMETKEIKEVIPKLIFLEVSIRNFSEETLTLSPRHVVIRDHKEPVGVFFEPGLLMTSEPSDSSQIFLSLIPCLDSSILEVQAGKTESRVLTFRALGKPFPLNRDLDICVDHVYLGYESLSLTGRMIIQSCNQN